VNRLDVGHVPDDVILEEDPVSAQQVTCVGQYLAGLRACW